MKTAVLIPCYNEATSIEKVINDFKQQLPDATIYVYDNNSTDNTADIARRAGAVVKHEFRQGKGNVVRSMFRDIDADCYLMVDGDDTYPAENAKEMCQLVEEGADMVIGDRLSSTYFTENKRPFHNDGNRLVRFLINKIFNNNIHDIMTGYRALSRTFVKNFPITSRNFEIETEMTIHALDKNFLIREVKINYRDRQEGSVSKLNTYLDGMKVVSTIFMMFRDYRPLKFFTIISALLMLIAIAMFVPVFIEYMQTGLVPRFPTLIVSGFIGIASLLTFFCGVVLEVITKKHKQIYEMMLLKN
ncbi:MAG: glycosyltransferase family 2 protein [Prevotella sp.]|uniref:glycosyltransferase family 2 protein n=1 Tax=Prevotella sp. TaxID=59823 RepID=UPI0025FEE248|nr:glycosyltransferase family 2 protein [Prevotella sp.]MCI7118228.1 glycosyltransferase family 2 protein [Prevotella sp.]